MKLFYHTIPVVEIRSYMYGVNSTKSGRMRLAVRLYIHIFRFLIDTVIRSLEPSKTWPLIVICHLEKAVAG